MRGLLKLSTDSSICSRCIWEEPLKTRIVKSGITARCSYCGRSGRTLTISRLAELIAKAFWNLYEIGEEEVEYDAESDHWTTVQRGESLEDAIGELTGAESEINSALFDELSSIDRSGRDGPAWLSPYDSEMNYVHADFDNHGHFRIWHEFQERIKHSVRFYDPQSAEKLKAIFENVETFSFAGSNKPLRLINPGCNKLKVFRARRIVEKQIGQIEQAVYKLGVYPALGGG